jgi:hypothetical protein
MQIKQTKGTDGGFDASIEETWLSPTQWTRTVTARGLTQTIVVNETGAHYVTNGTYFPNWLREFVTALFDIVPNQEEWNKRNAPLEHMEMANGMGSRPTMHAEYPLGVAPAQQPNFENVSFYPGDLIEFVGMPGYAMEFKGYQSFGHLQIPQTMVAHPSHGVDLTGTVAPIEKAGKADPKLFLTPPNATDIDPLHNTRLDSAEMMKLGVGAMDLHWPNPIPGKGMFTVWICLDQAGVIREVSTLNTDLSEFAADMAAQLAGRTWKMAEIDSHPVQAMGAIVYAYPPSARVGTKPASDK